MTVQLRCEEWKWAQIRETVGGVVRRTTTLDVVYIMAVVCIRGRLDVNHKAPLDGDVGLDNHVEETLGVSEDDEWNNAVDHVFEIMSNHEREIKSVDKGVGFSSQEGKIHAQKIVARAVDDIDAVCMVREHYDVAYLGGEIWSTSEG